MAVALVVLVAFVGGGAAQTAPGPSIDTDGGHRFDIGGDSPHITFWLHLDLLTNLGAAGDLGFSAVGTAMDTRVIVIDIQVNFRGVGPLENFLSNPFSRFSATAEWELNLPFLSAGPAADEDFTYRDNETIGGNRSGNGSTGNTTV
ncbi:hypothetical protein SAMN04487945_1150 [Halobacterium jilantaiense]|uniref:Uncharacterized protein n=1 Tax=Halobacterium jilantaiense TaxID=355548 RepID=A0A1I0NW09_9EURY|nr:hypothetical protein SAMN04487945_1150 [Halobacterium jilantaiense]